MIRLSHVLLNPKKAERHPIEMILVGFFYATLSLFLSLWVFPDYSSISMVFLTVLGCLYLVQGAIITNEEAEKKDTSEKNLLKIHSKTIAMLLFLFIGFIIAFTLWTIILPQPISELAFESQKSSVLNIQSITGAAISESPFFTILNNNLRVLFLSILFALFYGAGSILILVWNASIMGFVIGSVIKESLGLASFPLAFTKYFLHGIPEMAAYFIAALAGGIIFVSIIRGHFKKDRMIRTIKDLSALILISIIILIIAAFIEVYISASI